MEHPFERFQHGHVRFTFPVLLDALPVQDVQIRADSGDGADELLRECGLADAGLARDEDELALPLAGSAVALVEALQFRLAPDEQGPALDPVERG